MKPVASMMPEANDLTMRKRDLSGWKAETERANNGRQTPIRLVTRIVKTATSLRLNALFLSVHVLSYSGVHSLSD